MKLVRRALGMLLLVSSATPAWAQGVGGQAGFSVDPDQFYGGLHIDVRLADRVSFRPNAEVGVGDDLTVATLNFDFIYKYELQGTRWTLYQGGGPAINFYRAEGGDTDPEGGLNILIGIAHDSGFFTEFKVGQGRSPNLKFGFGFTFK